MSYKNCNLEPFKLCQFWAVDGVKYSIILDRFKDRLPHPEKYKDDKAKIRHAAEIFVNSLSEEEFYEFHPLPDFAGVPYRQSPIIWARWITENIPQGGEVEVVYDVWKEYKMINRAIILAWMKETEDKFRKNRIDNVKFTYLKKKLKEPIYEKFLSLIKKYHPERKYGLYEGMRKDGSFTTFIDEAKIFCKAYKGMVADFDAYPREEYIEEFKKLISQPLEKNKPSFFCTSDVHQIKFTPDDLNDCIVQIAAYYSFRQADPGSEALLAFKRLPMFGPEAGLHHSISIMGFDCQRVVFDKYPQCDADLLDRVMNTLKSFSWQTTCSFYSYSLSNNKADFNVENFSDLNLISKMCRFLSNPISLTIDYLKDLEKRGFRFDVMFPFTLICISSINGNKRVMSNNPIVESIFILKSILENDIAKHQKNGFFAYASYMAQEATMEELRRWEASLQALIYIKDNPKLYYIEFSEALNELANFSILQEAIEQGLKRFT